MRHNDGYSVVTKSKEYRMTSFIIGKNVRKYRRLRGMSQQQLAKRAFGDERQSSYISRLEKGYGRCTLYKIVAIAMALNIRTTDLCNRDILYYYENSNI